MDEKLPYVTEIDGKIVLVDPVAYAMVQTVNKYNCHSTFMFQKDRINYFKGRAIDRNDPNIVITIINVNTQLGEIVAEILMPGHDWQAYRDRGEIPYARGLATKDGMIDIISDFDKEAADKIPNITGIPVIVIDFDTVEIFSV